MTVVLAYNGNITHLKLYSVWFYGHSEIILFLGEPQMFSLLLLFAYFCNKLQERVDEHSLGATLFICFSFCTSMCHQGLQSLWQKGWVRLC